MDRPTPTQLLRLGLTDLQAAVLAAVAAEGDTTTPAVVGRTGAGRAAVSTALAVLEERGLVERDHGRRPEPVRLAGDLEDVLTGLLEEREAEHERRTREAREAVTALLGALARRAARPRPDVRRLEPGAFGPVWHTTRARRTLDVVAPADDPVVVWGGGLGRPGRRDRLLVVGVPPSRCVERHRLRGVDVRLAAEQLPAVTVADGTRARVEVAAEGRGGRGGWTEDPPQVRALQRLFELWWSEAA